MNRRDFITSASAAAAAVALGVPALGAPTTVGFDAATGPDATMILIWPFGWWAFPIPVVASVCRGFYREITCVGGSEWRTEDGKTFRMVKAPDGRPEMMARRLP